MRPRWQGWLPIFFLFPSILLASSRSNNGDAAFSTSSSKHTNNWAVLVSASRYWFNYRHMSNALGMYRTVKRLGIPDSNIILMLADDVACNPRNCVPGAVFASSGINKPGNLDLYGDNIEVDYRGYEVTVENFIRVLTGRHSSSTPPSKRLLSTASSNVFIYMTGHGGDGFLKFQDSEEIGSQDIADAIAVMFNGGRYNELFFMVDTCQADSMYTKIYSPNVLATGSSQVGENSYSYENDADIGVAVIDSFTHHSLEFMEGINKTSRTTMADFFSTFSYDKIHSHAGVRADLFQRPLAETLITDFFGGVARVEVDEDGPSERLLQTEKLAGNVTVESGASPSQEATPYLLEDEDFEELLARKEAMSPMRLWAGIAIITLLVSMVALPPGLSLASGAALRSQPPTQRWHRYRPWVLMTSLLR